MGVMKKEVDYGIHRICTKNKTHHRWFIQHSCLYQNNVICRHLDEVENNSRGAISQDILEQLTKFVNHVMLKFYANGREIPITAENIAKATEFAQINSELYTLYKFHNYLEVVTTQYTLDEDGSERLMLKYYQYLLKCFYWLEILIRLMRFNLEIGSRY